jgi:hypothetical protein
VLVKRQSARIFHDMDLRLECDDHLPTSLACKLLSGGGGAPFRFRKASYNRALPRVEPFRSEYADAPRQVPLPQYFAEASSHSHGMSKCFSSILVGICGTPAAKPVQYHVSDGTVALCNIKGSFLAARRQLTYVTFRAPLKATFLFGKNHHRRNNGRATELVLLGTRKGGRVLLQRSSV